MPTSTASPSASATSSTRCSSAWHTVPDRDGRRAQAQEISYIHAEAYPAGELKHGPLALVDESMP